MMLFICSDTLVLASRCIRIVIGCTNNVVPGVVPEVEPVWNDRQSASDWNRIDRFPVTSRRPAATAEAASPLSPMIRDRFWLIVSSKLWITSVVTEFFVTVTSGYTYGLELDAVRPVSVAPKMEVCPSQV